MMLVTAGQEIKFLKNELCLTSKKNQVNKMKTTKEK